MRRRIVRLVVLFGILAATVLGIGRLLRDSEPRYHLSVGQIVANPTRWQGENVSVMGIVQPGSQQRFGAERRFNIVSDGQTLSVRYTGLAPNTFVDAAEVLVKGKLRDREVNARSLLVKVPG